MSTFFRSLYGRISTAYLFLLVAFCLVSVVVTINTSGRYMQESDQRLNRTLAEYLARQVSPFLVDGLDLEAVEKAMHDLMAQNPRIEIYLLDETGDIITFAADDENLKHDQVRTAPIQAFLDEQPDLPILGTDPRSDDKEKIFSAFPVQLEGEPGYVYIILRGKQYDSMVSMVKDNYILRAAAVFLFLVFVFAALAGLLLFALLTGRVKRIVRVVRDFKEGRLERRLDVRGQDQLAQIEQAFNEMASTIQASVIALTSREDLRREFIANVSHDLKSPITSIRGYLETTMMKNETLSAEERMEYLQIVFEETERLDNLISQLLELSKLDAKGAHPDPEPFLVCELVQDVLTHFRPMAERLDVTLQSPLTRDLPMVNADIGMIERVLFNLIDNALRHTPASGQVEVNGTSLDKRVRLFVKDTGYGISPDDLAHVAERFYKGKHRHARAPGNTGLGLAISKRILELHGSALVIESTVNVGTTISFELEIADLEEEARM
jgi:signal transduction histidine kinase